MVRKRTRKTYESDENDSDSDLDFLVQPAASEEPAPKKYSLRERKNTSAFTSDFDYYGLALDDEDDGEERKGSTDDEDFEVDPEEAQLLENDSSPPPPTNVTVSTYLEEPTNSSDNPDGLIDFEDMIRADIVVNRNRIDYDNLIQKTEIKMTVNKKRGRKPKNFAEYDLCPLSPEPEENNEPEDDLYEPEAEEEDDDDDDGLDGDAKALLQPEVSLSENEPLPVVIAGTKLVESGEKDESDKQVKDHLAVKEAKEDDPPKIVDVPQPPPEPPQEEEEEEDDDDVIVLGEVKQNVDVIVLDD